MDSHNPRIFKFTKDNRSVAMPPPSMDIPDVSFGRSSTDVDENKERGNWSSGVEFLLSCLSYAVGLGNIWRFPYLCYRNGGGAFLIPYIIMMAFVGLPLFLMELSFGQYASEGPVTIWKICPLFQGLGYAMFVMSSLVGVYYNMILAWALFYLMSSFTTHLPWSSCDNWWNTEACRKFDTRNCSAHNGTILSNGTCVFEKDVPPEEWKEFLKHNSKMASDEYFHFSKYCDTKEHKDHVNRNYFIDMFTWISGKVYAQFAFVKSILSLLTVGKLIKGDYFNTLIYISSIRITWPFFMIRSGIVCCCILILIYLETILFDICNFVLDITDGVHDLGGLRWQLALCLLACWTIVFVCLLKGVKSMGKVVYFTALFPYLVLVILLIRGTTLEGSYDGIIFYLTPEWHRLLEARVWGDAAMQIFFSLSPCWGGLITLASYNRFHNNCYRDSLFITLGNSATSFFAGFVIFSIVGFMAHEMGVPVKEVARQGAGLAFVAYPEAVARLPVSPLWAILFFFMLLTLGLGTQFTLIETVCTTIVDTFPERLRRAKAYVLCGVCLVMYLAGLVICTKGGMYVLQLMDNYCASFSALIIGLVEVIVIGWIYGAERFLEDVKVMMGSYPFHYQYWRFMWRFVVPLLIAFILIFTCLELKPTEYGDYQYPPWATYVGWMFSLASVSAIPIVVILKIYRAKGPILQRIRILLEPTEEWGPKLQMHRMETHSPKHTDSQVPLALPNYDPDGYGENDFGDNMGSKISIGDDSCSEFEGLRLNIPSHVTETGV